MKICFTGTVSVGKSTLVTELSKLPEFKEYHIATERSKYLRDLGVKLNTDSTVKGQLLFIAERASELFHDNLLADRSPWCVSAFTISAQSIDLYQTKLLCKTALLLKDEYDIVFYISPEGIPIEDNQVRETNSIYRDKIDNAIQELLMEYPPKRLIKINTSNLQDRIEAVKSAIFS